MKQHNLVDLVKFLLSILVVAIHMGVPILAELGRIAVPYFFIISGYFFFGKYNSSPDLKSRQRLFYKYSKRIMQLFSSWLVIYLPLVFLGIYNSKDPLAVSIFGLVSGRLPNFGQAWYLIASITGLGTFLILKHCLPWTIVLSISVITEIFIILSTSYFGLLHSVGIFIPGSKYVLYLFPRPWIYFTIGYVLSKLRQFNIRHFWLPLLLLAYAIETVLITTFSFQYRRINGRELFTSICNNRFGTSYTYFSHQNQVCKKASRTKHFHFYGACLARTIYFKNECTSVWICEFSDKFCRSYRNFVHPNMWLLRITFSS